MLLRWLVVVVGGAVVRVNFECPSLACGELAWCGTSVLACWQQLVPLPNHQCMPCRPAIATSILLEYLRCVLATMCQPMWVMLKTESLLLHLVTSLLVIAVSPPPFVLFSTLARLFKIFPW